MEGLYRIGELSVQYVSLRGFHRELLVIYDLALPTDFHAVCHDDEIEESIRLPFRELTARLADPREFKSARTLSPDQPRRAAPDGGRRVAVGRIMQWVLGRRNGRDRNVIKPLPAATNPIS